MSCIAEKCAKTFGADPVFEKVSLRIDQGEIVCLMGPSGAGKTTLLRCLCGLELPEKGTISLSGTVLCQDGRWCDPIQYRQKIGLVFQNWNLFPHWTVLRNLTEAPVRLKGTSRKEAEKKALRLLEQLKIEQKAQAYPNSLSGGQKQRAAIARACMLAPEILCFDEPTSALDEQSALDVTQIIQDLAAQGLGILIVTHDEQFARRTGTRLVRLSELQSNS
ncbi:amino acid ABC transporter ATP-binding protein [Holdemania massiliensis]|uniref:ATP-binding cassette domain-containing protein n=1 Tax=Holdemania massiliensis TaxID=1468449 RepID=A0A6N7S9J5_9FIRM|nr:ATP-binding cassette domain-containing protein [Holdemania massiliensis]MSA72251.1 ATP-binding cassette domain-containing protein [Holdemania massiliensis]MSA90527.1 ATP-binding cassette domain-containing protein [Holdemania massiliensis]MSB79333.1 ATP-binding cassette domain-containing protein [Holdemania massiliensis]MSC34257.1 ATP-binding cassette domain-containing protein [Holdemania massiliensis]MSC40647.1 ATP-binding cassette domain-containing protein [Holdemania massiliensis]